MNATIGIHFFSIMENSTYQYIIIGAGCAGMQMAKALLELPEGFVDSILVIESNPEPYEKSWCFWKNEDHPYRNLMKYEWSSLAFRSTNYNASNPLKTLTYQYINSLDFDAFHKNLFKKDKRVTLIHDSVQGISQLNELCAVECKNQSYIASKVFNSVPKISQNAFNPNVWQHFLGWEIKTNTDVFNEQEVTLMDFKVDENNDGRFMYILPFSKNAALIECTIFSDTVVPIENYEKSILNYIKTNFDTTFEIRAKEKGVIPMHEIKKVRGSEM
jgi:lycopene beta-cyclase